MSGCGLGGSRVFLERPQGVFSRSVKTLLLTLRVLSGLRWFLGGPGGVLGLMLQQGRPKSTCCKVLVVVVVVVGRQGGTCC